MSRVLTGVSGTVHKITDPAQVEKECPENFNLLSDCFAAIVFGGIDVSGHVLVRKLSISRAQLISFQNYTIRSDFGLAMTDVKHHGNDDTQTRLLPLQWAIDSVRRLYSGMI